MKCYTPGPGNVWSPLMKLKPNERCPCGSGKKWKKCHRQKSSMVVSEKEAPALEQAIKQIRRRENGKS